jgi:F-type H+-transporting ATPase subunit b
MDSRLRRGVLQAIFCFALLVMVYPARAQEQEVQREAQEKALLDRVGRWKVINTAIFAVLLGWYIAKKAPQFFQARSSDIQRAIQEATGLKLEADYRHSEIDRRLANLAEEVKKIRAQAEAEMEREHARLRNETEVEIERIRHNAVNEVEALRKEAAERLKLHAAQLAFEEAERRLNQRFARGEPSSVIDDFIRLVERSKN